MSKDSIQVSYQSPGSHQITAVYGGDPNFQGGTSAVLSEVVRTPTATFMTSSLTPGVHQITASYGGDQAFAGSVSPVVSQQVGSAAMGCPPSFGGGWSGGGIVGTYYANSNFTGSSFQRRDVRIDMTPTTVLPGGSLASDPVYGSVVGPTNFSAKWVGTLIPKHTTTYTLKAKSGGALTLKIGGTTVLVATSTMGWASVNVDLVAGQAVAVELDMSHTTGPWSAQLHWVGLGSIPFPEEAIGPATPIGVNLTNFLDNKSCLANCGLFAGYNDHLGGSTGPALDSSGWPTGDFSFDQLSCPGFGTGPYSFPHGFSNDGRTGVWTISFSGAAGLATNNTGIFLIGHNDGRGRAQVTLNGLTYYAYPAVYQAPSIPITSMAYDAATGTGYNPATNTTVALFDLRNSGWDNVAFVNTDRNGKGAPGGPTGTAAPGLTNVFCMRPKAVGSTASYALGTALHDPFLTMLAPYAVVRCLASAFDLDYVRSLTSPPTDWSSRGTPVFNVKASNKSQYPNTVFPWEVQIMLANQAGKDLYINLPQSASGNASDPNCVSSYIYQLASLLKNGGTLNGVTYPGLLPHLCVYIEYGNENWNFSLAGPYGSRGDVVWDSYFHQQANTQDWQQYSAMGGWVTYGGTPPNVSTGTATLWTALKAKDASDLFRLVYGSGAMPGGPLGLNPDPRIRPLLEWQYGGDWNGEGYDATRALDAIQAHFGVPANHIFWGGGGGWYLTANTPGANADAVFANITPDAATQIFYNHNVENSIQRDVDRLARYGLRHVGYEGGFEFGPGSGGSSDGQQQASNDPRIKPYVKLTLDTYFQAGGALPVVFQADGGAYGFGQEWSVIDGMWNQPPYAPAPPKLQAYLDASATLPAAPVINAAWQYAPSNFSVHQGFQAGRPSFIAQTFVVQTPGTYSVGLTTASYAYPQATTSISIILDGTVVGVLQNTNAHGGDSLYVPVYLAAGVHSLVISVGALNPSTGGLVIDPWGVK